MLSVNNWRMRRKRLAPIARRMASSLCRTEARASCRIATLVQATNRTKPTSAMSSPATENKLRSNSGSTLLIGTRVTVHRLLWLGWTCSTCRVRMFMLARACSKVTPGFRRPTTKSKWTPRSLRRSKAGITSACIMSGTHASTLSGENTPRNPSVVTPMTV